jgi:hypothetical protein
VHARTGFGADIGRRKIPQSSIVRVPCTIRFPAALPDHDFATSDTPQDSKQDEHLSLSSLNLQKPLPLRLGCKPLG